MAWWWQTLISFAVALLVAWIALLIALLVAEPDKAQLNEALRLLPDLWRLVRRLAADRSLGRGVRIRLELLLAYLALTPLRPDPRLHAGPRLRRRRDGQGPLAGTPRRMRFIGANKPR